MPRNRGLTSAGALLAAMAVALSAYAAHASDAHARGSLFTAAALAFGHGLALAALSRGAHRRLTRLALAAMLLGALLFAGGIVVAHFSGSHAVTAPFGGGLLIAAWLLYAIDSLRG